MRQVTDPDEFMAYAVSAFAEKPACTSIVAGALTANRKLMIATGIRAEVEGFGEVGGVQITMFSESEARDFAAKILAPFNERSTDDAAWQRETE